MITGGALSYDEEREMEALVSLSDRELESQGSATKEEEEDSVPQSI